MATKRTRREGGSGRTTPKGTGATSGSLSARENAEGRTGASARYTPPSAIRLRAPSRMWVPVLMFSLLGIGALLIILNYVGALGSVNNAWLVVGLAFILGGIITATQYR
jgi:hypothetical protein